MKQRLLNTYYRLLGSLARRYLAKTKPIIIGINGSVGKTSCRMIVSQILKELLPNADIYTSPKNFNGELGMSLSIFHIEKYKPGIIGLCGALFTAIKKSYSSAPKYAYPEILLLEYGIDHPGEMAFLISIAKPDYTIHTQIDSVHSLQFGNPDKIAIEEFLLEQNTRNTVFLNTDDPYLHHVQGSIPCDVITYSASKKNTNTTICIAKESTDVYKTSPQSTLIKNTAVQQETITFNGKKTITLGINLLGSYHLAYAAVGTCLADMLAYRMYQKEAYVDGDNLQLFLSLQSGRWSVFVGIEKSIIIDSSYNASPRSMHSIIQETLDRGKNMHPDYKSILVLGEMRELGGEEEKAHIALSEFLTDFSCPLFLIGNAMNTSMKKYFETHGGGKLQEIYYFNNYADLGESLKAYIGQHSPQPYLVLFKGSQNTIFLEEAIKYILANKDDEQKLTRQGEWRAHKKQEFLTKALQSSAETL